MRTCRSGLHPKPRRGRCPECRNASAAAYRASAKKRPGVRWKYITARVRNSDHKAIHAACTAMKTTVSQVLRDFALKYGGVRG